MLKTIKCIFIIFYNNYMLKKSLEYEEKFYRMENYY